MKVKLKNLPISNQVLAEFVSLKMDGVLGFKLMEIGREIEHKLKTLEEARMKLIQDNNGKQDEDSEDKSYKFETPEIEEKVNKEFQEILEQEVDIHARPLTFADLEKMPHVEPMKLGVLSWAVEKE